MQPSAFMPDTIRQRMGLFYDTLVVAANTATATLYTLFSAPISATKGIELTNMVDSGKLPIPTSMQILAVRAMTIGMDLDDIENLMKKYALRLKIGNKVFLEAPIQAFPGGGGVSGAVATTATTTTLDALTNGAPDPRAVYGLAQFPLPLPSGVNFSVELQGTSFTTKTGAAGIFLQIYLDGIITEGLQ